MGMAWHGIGMGWNWHGMAWHGMALAWDGMAWPWAWHGTCGISCLRHAMPRSQALASRLACHFKLMPGHAYTAPATVCHTSHALFKLRASSGSHEKHAAAHPQHPPLPQRPGRSGSTRLGSSPARDKRSVHSCRAACQVQPGAGKPAGWPRDAAQAAPGWARGEKGRLHPAQSTGGPKHVASLMFTWSSK